MGIGCLEVGAVAKSYKKKTRTHLLLFDYGGTILSIDNQDSLSRFQMVTKSRAPTVPNLGLAAEHGMFISWPTAKSTRHRKWETIIPDQDRSWRSIVITVMEVYTSRTHGSYVHRRDWNEGSLAISWCRSRIWLFASKRTWGSFLEHFNCNYSISYLIL